MNLTCVFEAAKMMVPYNMKLSYDIELLERFRPFRERLEREGLNNILLRNFEHSYARLLTGEVGWLPESEILPVTSLPDAEALTESDYATGKAHLHETVVIKLNGGLGTGMGLDHAKSLLPVRGELTFLDIIARQVLHYDVPLLLMNSFATHEESLNALRKYPELDQNLMLDFVQHTVPKVSALDFSPAIYPSQPELEWCPPGHGDLYAAIAASGVLEQLIERGYSYAFVSNADNLGAVLHAGILGHFISRQLDFLMEAADRTNVDKKGGHLAIKDGRYILRESAQCPETDVPFFQDVQRHRFFNTNNLWINLKSLKAMLVEHDYLMPLPLIVNKKNINPLDKASAQVYQLETAMGAAISVFNKTEAIRVSRARFAPVKDTNDLLVVCSDAYQLARDGQLVPNPDRRYDTIEVQLDKAFYKFSRDFQEHFSAGFPSLVNCRSLNVRGDVYWGENVRLEGDVTVINDSFQPQTVPSGSTLNGTLIWR
jgi:UTP--glucose-1-phosphate uridylyltransferase